MIQGIVKSVLNKIPLNRKETVYSNNETNVNMCGYSHISNYAYNPTNTVYSNTGYGINMCSINPYYGNSIAVNNYDIRQVMYPQGNPNPYQYDPYAGYGYQQPMPVYQQYVNAGNVNTGMYGAQTYVEPEVVTPNTVQMLEMCTVKRKESHIPVDKWDTEEYPINESDRIFKHAKGRIILPLSDTIYKANNIPEAINNFMMDSKRSYNSDEIRNHICRYLNYFFKFYDTDYRLYSIIANIKYLIDFNPNYTKDAFIYDVIFYIINDTDITNKISNFVDDNYNMKLSSNSNKTPNLEFDNNHAKLLYMMSMYMNIYIPLATHYMYIHGIRRNANDVQNFMLTLFSACNEKIHKVYNVDIYTKIWEIAASVVNKSKNPDRILWDKNLIRGNNTTTHTKDSTIDIIMNIIPKYDYEHNIIHFIYYSNRKCLNFRITGITFEFPFVKMSASYRDEDNNSDFDRYEATKNKTSQDIYIQNKVCAEQTVNTIESKFGEVTQDEIDFYRKRLTENGSVAINKAQKELIGYTMYKYFGDPVTMNAIPNENSYIKLLICTKRLLERSGLNMLPYIFASKFKSISSRKILSKNDKMSLEDNAIYNCIREKYNHDEKLCQKVDELIATLLSSKFEIIDYDRENKCAGSYDGRVIPMLVENVKTELCQFICNFI